jgi:hypothetical protein
VKPVAVIDLDGEAWDLLCAWKRDRDFTRLLVLADRCDELNLDDEAYVFRWMASHRVRPQERLHFRYHDGRIRAVPRGFGWAWYREHGAKYDYAVDGPSLAELPNIVFYALAFVRLTSFWQLYPTEETAIGALRDALIAGLKIFGLKTQEKTS